VILRKTVQVVKGDGRDRQLCSAMFMQSQDENCLTSGDSLHVASVEGITEHKGVWRCLSVDNF
jgi:hypothetical protein